MGGAGEGPLLRDAWFAVAFLCAVQQRRGVVLGRQPQRTSDALRCLLLMGLMLVGGWGGGGAFRADGFFLSLAQVGDGTTTQRNTPVSVAGLSSGVAMVALGGVRRVCDLCACLMLARERVCGLFVFLWCNCDHGGLRLREVDFGRCW